MKRLTRIIFASPLYCCCQRVISMELIRNSIVRRLDDASASFWRRRAANREQGVNIVQRRSYRRIFARIIAAMIVFILSQPAFGGNLTPQSAWTPTDNAKWLQPISIVPDGWLPVGDAIGSCDAARSRVAAAGTENLTLTSSGTPCGDTRSLAVTLEDGRLNLFATVSATQATMSLSGDFKAAFQYRLTDTLKVGVQEVAGVETSILSPLGAFGLSATPPLLGPVAWGPDATLTQFSVEYNPGSWSAQAAVVTSSLFTLQEIKIQNRITRDWTAVIGIERTVAGFGTVDAGQLTVSGRFGDVSVDLTYTRGTVADAFEPDSGFVAMLTPSTDTLGVSVSVPLWGWRWTLSDVGGATSGLTLTAQRSNITVAVSGDPLGVWLTHHSEF